MLSIFLREWRRLGKQPKVMLTTFLVPSLLIIAFMALMFTELTDSGAQTIAVITSQDEIREFIDGQTKYEQFQVYDSVDAKMEEQYDKGEIGLFIHINSIEKAISFQYDSTKLSSYQTMRIAQEFVSELAIYLEDDALYESYLKNAMGVQEQDISTALQRGEKQFTQMLNIIVAALTFLIGLPLTTFALDSYVGERERGTYDSIRLSGIAISKFVVGKIMFAASVGFLAGIVQMITILLGMKYFIGDMGLENYISNYGLLTVSAILLGWICVMILTAALVYVSTYFETLKEASMYATLGIMGFTVLTQLGQVVDNGILKYIPLVNIQEILISNAVGTEKIVPFVISLVIGIVIVAILTFGAVMKLNAKEQ